MIDNNTEEKVKNVEEKWYRISSSRKDCLGERLEYKPLEDFALDLYKCCTDDNMIETLNPELTKSCLGTVTCHKISNGDLIYKIKNDKFDTVVLALDGKTINFENIIKDQMEKSSTLPASNSKGLAELYCMNDNKNIEGRTIFSASKTHEIPDTPVLGENTPEDKKYRGLTGITISTPFGDFVETRYTYKNADKIGTADFYSLYPSTCLEIHDGKDIYRRTVLSPMETITYYAEKATAKGFTTASAKLSKINESLNNKMEIVKNYLQGKSIDIHAEEER